LRKITTWRSKILNLKIERRNLSRTFKESLDRKTNKSLNSRELSSYKKPPSQKACSLARDSKDCNNTKSIRLRYLWDCS